MYATALCEPDFLLLSKAPLEFHQPVSGGTQHHSQFQPHYHRQAAEEGRKLSCYYNLMTKILYLLVNGHFLLSLQGLRQLPVRQASIQEIWL